MSGVDEFEIIERLGSLDRNDERYHEMHERVLKSRDSVSDVKFLEYVGLNGHVDLRKIVARNFDTPVYILEKMVNDKHEVKCHLTANHRLPLELEDKLVSDENKYIRGELAVNTHSVRVMEKLIEDSEEYVLRNLLRNRRIPLELVVKLSDHEFENVRRDCKIKIHHLTPLSRSIS